ncbi:sigma-70 family RNA polymerase sigma factor [Synechococcus sp. PCC 7336]|uniref:sigma-70 family RNA polymerase sigma factor n=1 Tax=Synechococcus sp. PCC 7336 TaxID=195250 RepID=UPI0003473538|nr:sigma-70 family RNA polymerase sigma factor [Synechococcus sp. PCC 7336]
MSQSSQPPYYFYRSIAPNMVERKPVDDIDLVGQIARGERAALSALYGHYAGVVYALAFKILGSVEEAEEVVLDAFAQVWRSAEQYESQRGRVDTWLFTIARSRALDRLRSRQRSARILASVQAEVKVSAPTQIHNPADSVVLNERRERVQIAMQQLPDPQRLVLEMAYFQGLTQAEIATEIGKPVGTVKTRVRLGLSKLRDALGGLNESP